MTGTTRKIRGSAAAIGAIATAALIAGTPAAMAEGGQKSSSGAYQSGAGMNGSASSGMQSNQGRSEHSGRHGQASVSAGEVRQIQQALDQSGHDPGAVDGVWGQKTAKALKSFQQSKGLQPTGRPDKQTLAALGVNEATGGAGSRSGGGSSGSFGSGASGSDKGNTALPRSRSNAGGAGGSAEESAPR